MTILIYMAAKNFIPEKRDTYYLSIIVFLAGLLYFSYLGKVPIYILDEAKNAQCAREMLTRGDWVLPTFSGELRTDKPPLHYYFMMGAYRLFGVNEFSARFFSAVFGLLTLLMTYFFVKKHWDSHQAFIAVLVLLSSLHFSFETRLAVPDPYLIFLLSACLFSVFTFLQTKEIKFLGFFYSSFGLSILTKGPIALLLIGLIVLVYLLVKSAVSFKQIGELKPIQGILTLFIICLPWYIAVYKATNGVWTNGFLLEHNLYRYISVKEGHGGFPGLTTIYLLIGFLPFSIFIFQIVKNTVRFFEDSLIKFSAVVIIAFWLFFSVSKTQLPNYAMPCYPFVAVLIAKFITEILKEDGKVFKVPLLVYCILMGVIPFLIYYALKNEVSLAKLVILSTPFLLLPSTAFFSFVVWNKNKRRALLLMGGSFVAISLIFFSIIYPAVYNQNPVIKSLALLQTNQPVIAYRKYNPGFNFYLKKNVKRFEKVDELRKFIDENPDCVVLTREKYLPELKSLAFQKLFSEKDIFESSVTVILKPIRSQKSLTAKPN